MSRHGDKAALREFIAESAGMVGVHAELIQRYAELGDDVGLRYAVRRMAAYARVVIQTANDLGHDGAVTAREAKHGTTGKQDTTSKQGAQGTGGGRS